MIYNDIYYILHGRNIKYLKNPIHPVNFQFETLKL